MSTEHEQQARERIGHVLDGKWRLERLLGVGGRRRVLALLALLAICCSGGIFLWRRAKDAGSRPQGARPVHIFGADDPEEPPAEPAAAIATTASPAHTTAPANAARTGAATASSPASANVASSASTKTAASVSASATPPTSASAAPANTPAAAPPSISARPPKGPGSDHGGGNKKKP